MRTKKKLTLEVTLRKIVKEIGVISIVTDEEGVGIVMRTSTGGLINILTKGYLHKKGNLAIGNAEIEIWNPII